MTGSVLSGMKDFVEGCEKNFGSLKNKTVLDIGCNDGSLLNFLKKKVQTLTELNQQIDVRF